MSPEGAASAPSVSQLPPALRKRLSRYQRFIGFMRGRFSSGLLIIAPFVLTFLIFRWLYETASGVLKPFVEPITKDIFHREFTEAAVAAISVTALLVITWVIGWVAVNFIGQKLLYGLEAGFIRVPVIGPTFSMVKQLISTLGPGSGTGFSRVVEIEYPRKGTWAIGFLTGTTSRNGTKMGVVYLPTAPTPNSGWLAIVPMEDIYDLDMTPNQALGMTISAGMSSPEMIKRDSEFPASWYLERDPGAKREEGDNLKGRKKS